MAAIVKVYASELYDRLTAILVQDEIATMANVALYMWFAKYATEQLDELKPFYQNLFQYIQSGVPPAALVSLTRDFPAMFDWYGKDIAQSDQALRLMIAIGGMLDEGLSPLPHPFALQAEAFVNELDLTGRMEQFLDCTWPTPVLKLFVSPFLFNPTYIYPDTILCHVDPTCAEYVAMIGHEGGHILSLNVVNAPEFKETNRELAFHLAEALAHASQMSMVEAYSVRYEDLFPGKGIHTHADYFASGHPWLKDHSAMITRLAHKLQKRGERPLSDVYREVFDEFTTLSPHT